MKITEIIREDIPALPTLSIDPGKASSAIDTMNKMQAFVKSMGINTDNTSSAKDSSSSDKSSSNDISNNSNGSSTKSDNSSSTDNVVPSDAKASVGKDGSVIIGNQKRTGGTISWRCNNPGNVMYGAFAKSHGALGSAKAGDTEPVAIMPTLDHGIKMQMALWRKPMYNNGTIDQGMRKWATGVGSKKETSPYTTDLAKAAGATINTKVSDLSDNQLKQMVIKQAKWEGFKTGTVTQV
jgi:hypothetical protein